ncbi:MAG: phosphotransferase [Bacteroidales bacterium]|nr:phosphotransferase [Bacteroidales bacterium]
MNYKENEVLSFIEKKYGVSPTSITKLTNNGSNRIYWRFFINNNSYIVTYNIDVKENESFFYIQKFLKNHNINVPEIYHISSNKLIYVQQDLGNVSLYSIIETYKNNDLNYLRNLYFKILTDLWKIQNLSFKGFNFKNCYPVSKFSKEVILWDFYYFKYLFLKLYYIPFNELKLEHDFKKFASLLNNCYSNYFVYRDFQSRNIMLHNNKIYYIDFQSARKGSLFYDLASLVFDAKANISDDIKIELLNYYYKKSKINISYNEFLYNFYYFALFRIIQALGAYGYRGKYENKKQFIDSIPIAINNIEKILANINITFLPELSNVLKFLVNNRNIFCTKKSSQNLKLTITSFSYKESIPNDESGNGGGFVFDCRGLPNPAKDENLKKFTGIDKPIIDYMEQFEEVKKFLHHCLNVVSVTIDNYIERNFTNLMVNFGCTGGQHRSVYCAEKFAKLIQEKYDIQIQVIHTNKDKWEV